MNRNKIKANAISTAGDLLIAGACLAAFGVAYGLLGSINHTLATFTGVSLGYVVLRMLAPIVTEGLRPAIDRLNATPATDASKPKTSA